MCVRKYVYALNIYAATAIIFHQKASADIAVLINLCKQKHIHSRRFDDVEMKSILKEKNIKFLLKRNKPNG